MTYLLPLGFFCCVLLANDVYSLDLEEVQLTNSALQKLLMKIREQDAKIASLEAMVIADRKDHDVRIEKSNSKIKVLEDTIETLKRFILKWGNQPPSGNWYKMFSGNEKNHKTFATKISRPLEDYAAPYASLSDPGVEKDRTGVKRIADGRAAPAHIVAFHAYLSSPDDTTDPSHTIVFDTVITNAGSAYNRRDGLFTAPSEGVYVFNWVVYSQHQGDVITELVVNASSRGCSRADSHTLDEHHSSSGTVVVHLSQGDVVSVKTHSVWNSVGSVMSFTDYYKSSFSGWLLV